MINLINRLTGRAAYQSRIAAIEEHLRLQRDEITFLRTEAKRKAAQAQAALAMLEASRTEHAKALQRADELETAVAHMDELLRNERNLRNSERMAARMWIKWVVRPRVTTN